MRALADRGTASGAGDPSQVIEVAAEGAYVISGVMRVVGDDQLVIGLSRAVHVCGGNSHLQ